MKTSEFNYMREIGKAFMQVLNFFTGLVSGLFKGIFKGSIPTLSKWFLNIENLIKNKFTFLDLDKGNEYKPYSTNSSNASNSVEQEVTTVDPASRFEGIKDLATYSTNRIATTSKFSIIRNVFLACCIFCLVYGVFLVISKPTRTVEALKITREDMIDLKDGYSKEDIIFKSKKPIAIELEGRFYFSNTTPNDKGEFIVTLPRKEGAFDFLIYGYENGLIESKISAKPLLIKKIFDYTNPNLLDTKVISKYTNLQNTWSFDTDESSPFITMRVKDIDELVYDPTKNFADNKCKMEKIDTNKHKFTCPLVFAKEETFKFSAYMVDRVGNKVDILSNQEVTYLEPLKIYCVQPPSATTFSSIYLNCKSNRDTTVLIGGGVELPISKDNNNQLTLDLGGSVVEEKEYSFKLTFKDPNGDNKENNYTIFKDNKPPKVAFVPTISGVGPALLIDTLISGFTEDTNIEYKIEETTAPNANWYYKYPAGETLSAKSNDTIKISNNGSQFPLCNNQLGPETCPSTYYNLKPSTIAYTIKASDKLGNATSYLCSYRTTAPMSGGCSQL
jgi:hypothetical protein